MNCLAVTAEYDSKTVFGITVKSKFKAWMRPQIRSKKLVHSPSEQIYLNKKHEILLLSGWWVPPTVPLYKPRLGGKQMKVNSKDLSLTAIFASLYAVLVYLFAPMSFFGLQFRIAGVIRPAVARKWILAIGYAIGVVVGNIFSPFAGLHELVFMPFMSLVAGTLGHVAAKRFDSSYFVAGTVIAVIIPLSVSWMLNQLFSLPIIATLPYLLISEQLVCFIGACIFRLIDARFKWWQ